MKAVPVVVPRRELAAGAFVLVLAGGAVASALAPSGWLVGILLASILVACVMPVLILGSIASRFALFFGLLALVDFLKRLVFLVPGQAPFSQYLVFLVPTGVYVVGVLLPGIRALGGQLHRGAVLFPLAYVLVALLNTWGATGAPFLAKAAATALLILPWTILPVALCSPEAFARVAWVLVGCAVLSTTFAMIQFVFGPTLVDVRWAHAVGDLSIGASKLAEFWKHPDALVWLWRVDGFQPDAFTFAMFDLTALAAAQLLRAWGALRRAGFIAVGSLLTIGVVMSLTRTMWLATAAALVFTWAARRHPLLLRPPVIVLLLVGAVVAGQVGAYVLHSLIGLRLATGSAVLGRALLVGTVEARLGGLQAFLSALHLHGLVGVGHAAQPWVSDKLGGPKLPPNSSAHNFLVEEVWLVGVPGLLLFWATLYSTIRGLARRGVVEDTMTRSTAAVLVGYLIGMFLSGLGNGGVFLGYYGYYYFFFSGVLAGALGGTDPGCSTASRRATSLSKDS